MRGSVRPRALPGEIHERGLRCRASKSRSSWEVGWAMPAGAATFVAVALLIVSRLRQRQRQRRRRGRGPRARPTSTAARPDPRRRSCRRSASSCSSSRSSSSSAPSAARSDRVRSQLIGLVVAAPLFFAALDRAQRRRHQRSGRPVRRRRGEVDADAPPEASEGMRLRSQGQGRQDVRRRIRRRPGEAALAACERTRSKTTKPRNAISEASLTAVADRLRPRRRASASRSPSSTSASGRCGRGC